MHIAHRDDRSTASAAVQNLFIRPLQTQLRKSKQFDHEGSPRLSPPMTVKRTCHITERQVGEIWVYDLVTKQAKEDHPNPEFWHKRIYYFAGVSWQSPTDDAHFKMMAALAKRLEQPSIISIVSCPVAPKTPAPKALPLLIDLYRALMKEPKFEHEDICFLGDSSGGNLVLALTMYCLDTGQPPIPTAPDSLVLVSPTVDLVHDHPELAEVAERDPLGNVQYYRETASIWAGGMDRYDPRLSPTFGNIKSLAEHNVSVFIIAAGNDVLGVEAMTFAEKCQEAGVQGRAILWQKQMHDFPLTAAYGVPEGLKALDWIALALDEGGRRMNENTSAKFEAIEREKEEYKGEHEGLGEDMDEEQETLRDNNRTDEVQEKDMDEEQETLRDNSRSDEIQEKMYPKLVAGESGHMNEKKDDNDDTDDKAEPSKRHKLLQKVKSAKESFKEECKNYHPSA